MARSRVFVWVGRVLLLAGAVYGLYHDDVCGSAFFPGGVQDSFTQALCTGVLADRRGFAILLLFFGVAATGAGQVLGIREETASKDGS